MPANSHTTVASNEMRSAVERMRGWGGGNQQLTCIFGLIWLLHDVQIIVEVQGVQ